jgi:EAL domain-containing protein (putative c-di-GMP-specific phosphodiesterase class I)
MDVVARMGGDEFLVLLENGMDAMLLPNARWRAIHEPVSIEHCGFQVSGSIGMYGTGYSSFAYHKRFPAQTLKIERSFMRDLPHDTNEATITKALVAMAHSLGIDVVAKGVKSEAQLAFLRDIGCDAGQGYPLGRPMPPDALVARRHDRPASAQAA